MHMKCLAQSCNRGKHGTIGTLCHCTILSPLPPHFLSVGISDFWSQPHLSPSPQGSSSSDSLEGQSCDFASKSYDAVVFDVLKVTPEEFAVSNKTDVGAGTTAGC